MKVKHEEELWALDPFLGIISSLHIDLPAIYWQISISNLSKFSLIELPKALLRYWLLLGVIFVVETGS